MTKNITLTVDEEILKHVRIYAAERRTSVNAMVRDYLAGLVAREREADDAREALLKLARAKRGDMGSQKWDRESLYDR